MIGPIGVTGSTGCVGTRGSQAPRVPTGPIGVTGSVGPIETTTAEVRDMTQILKAWIESGELGDYQISMSAESVIVFHLTNMLGGRGVKGSVEIQVHPNLQATIWYKTNPIKRWDLHDAKQFEFIGKLLSRHGDDGSDPNYLVREWDRNGSI